MEGRMCEMAWKTVRAGEFCSFVTDGTHDSPKPQSQGRKLITSKHLKGDHIDFDSANWISECDYQKIIARSAVEQWDILFSMIGTIGTIYLEKSPIVEYACKNMGVFKFAGNAENAFWMYYYLKSPQAKEYIQSHLRGSTQAYVPLGSLREMPVSIPDRETRNRIVSLLKPLDEKIATNRAINDNLEQQAQALFKSWFVEFKPFNGTMPSDWEIVPLEKIADFQNGYAFKSKELLNEPSPDCYQVFKQGHIARGGGFIPDGTKSWYPKSIASKLEKFVLKKGDILMAMTDMKDNVAILGNTAVMPLDNEYIVNQRVGHLRANGYKGVTYPFIYLLTNSTDFLVDLRSRANSGVQVNLSSSEIKASQTVLPSEEVNNAFSEITLPMFEIIINNQLENQRLAQLRDTLLPKLISGELDVSTVEL